MELWIRNQNKEQLRKIVDLKYQKGTIDDDDIEVILGTAQYDEWEVLGIYKNKERSLEVLDEIHQRLLDLQVLEIAPDGYKVIKRNIDCVYEMPKE